MIIPTKKLRSGLELPVFALGTWKMGGKMDRVKNYDPKKDIEAIHKAFELGVTRFDTAEVYADGYSEEILGEALKDFERSELFITSKVLPGHLRYDDVLKSFSASLKRLGMEYLDLYLIHIPNHEIPIKETMKAFDKLVDQGFVKNIGVSNFNINSFEEAQQSTQNKIVLNQVHYNLIFREPQLEGVLEYCQTNDVFLEAWRPIQQGNLSKPGIVLLDEMCKKYKKTQSQIAINWLISQKNVVTLTKTSNLKHLEEDVGALGWQIEDEDVEKLLRDFPIQLDKSNTVQLG